MKIKKDMWREITLKDIIKAGVFDGVEVNDHDPEIIIKQLDKVNQALKEYFINKELDRVKRQHNKIDPEFNLITTDYFKHTIDDTLTVIASRTVEPGPEAVENKYNNWLFKGYITLYELQKLTALYPVFQDLYNEYSRDNWQLELDIIGGIIQGYVVVDRESLKKWKDKGVMFELYGFNEDNKLTSYTDILVDSYLKMKDQAQKIKEKGKPENLQEARILKLDEEGKQLFNQMFY